MSISKSTTIVLGEKRKFMLRLWLTNHPSFTPTGPTYELVKLSTNVTVAEGSCDVSYEGTAGVDYTVILSAYIQPESAGDYALKFKFGFADELMVKIGYITVLTPESKAYRMASDLIVG